MCKTLFGLPHPTHSRSIRNTPRECITKTRKEALKQPPDLYLKPPELYHKTSRIGSKNPKLYPKTSLKCRDPPHPGVGGIFGGSLVPFMHGARGLVQFATFPGVFWYKAGPFLVFTRRNSLNSGVPSIVLK